MNPTAPRFLETIRIQDGSPCNLPYHQARMERTLRAHYPLAEVPSLAAHLTRLPERGIHKCRILYSDHIQSISYERYTPKEPHTFTLIESSLNYAYKYADRSELDHLKKCVGSDEIILLKNGLLSDTSYSNIAFYDGTKWLTPRLPLLEGTMRSRLLDEGAITSADIAPQDLKHFRDIALINAMIGFRILHDVKIFDKNGDLLFNKKD